MKRALLLCLVATAAQAAPKIEFDRMVYDFGKTSLVDSVGGTFTFRNTGDEVLQVGQPKPSCGCTVAKIAPNSVKPGEKGALEFTLTVGQHAQQFHKEIRVPSNDPTNPVVVLGLRAEIVAAFEATPRTVQFGELPLGTTTNATVVIKRLDGRKLAIAKIEPTSNAITARAEPLDDQSVNLRLNIRAEGQPRRLSEMVHLFTADSKGPAVTIIAAARFLGDIELDPEALAWGMPDPEHWNVDNPDFALERSITITSKQSDRPLEIRNVATTVPGLKVAIETIETNKEFELTASLSQPLKQPVSGVITFETNLPSLPKVEIPVEINVWRR